MEHNIQIDLTTHYESIQLLRIHALLREYYLEVAKIIDRENDCSLNEIGS